MSKSKPYRAVTLEVAAAQPAKVVKVSEDEIRRVLTALQVRGLGIVPIPVGEKTTMHLDDICSDDGVVNTIFGEESSE